MEQNLDLLLKIDAELRSVAGVTLAETNMNFRREESVVRIFGRRGDSSDEIHDRRGLRGICVCGERDSEAVVSEFLWRAVAE